MRIILITSFVPTPDNFRGPSAMMYHLLKGRPDDCELRVYVINDNNVPQNVIQASSESLRAEIIELKDDLFNYFHKRHTLNTLRIVLHIDKYYGQSNYRLRKSTLREIENFAPDLVWVFGEDKTTIIKQMASRFKTLVAGYDCFPLHYSRLLSDSYCKISESIYKDSLHKNKVAISREVALRDVPCTYFDVGIADRNMFMQITGRNDARFYPHPHFGYTERDINFQKPVLSIMISGALDQYTYTDAHKLLDILCTNPDLASLYDITFVGRGWESFVDKLSQSGYNASVKTWVDDYNEELASHDVQIFPISVGSGTKGKVLCAMTMGVLCIGSAVAMENIFSKHGYSCFQYDSVDQVPDFLRRIYADKAMAELMAERARRDVLKWHNPERILNRILEDVFDGKEYDGEQEYNQFIKECLSPEFQ